MSDLIRREDVNDLIKQICDACGEGEKYNGVMCRCCRFDDFIGVVDNIPSAEPERKKGEWIKEDLSGYLTPGGNSIYHCSECGHTEGPWPHPRLTNFCPSCGANMRGEDGKA